MVLNVNAQVRIRVLLPQDFPFLANWMVAVPLWQRYDLTLEKAVSQFEKANLQGDILLAADYAANENIGFAWCVPDGAFGHSGYLRLIGVHPDYAGLGIGARLLAEVETQVRQTSDTLFLLVSDFNHEAQRFYQRQGYQQTGAIESYVIAGITELIFWKRLSAFA